MTGSSSTSLLQLQVSLTIALQNASMPVELGHLFPLCMRLLIGDEMHDLCVDRDDGLCRLRGFRGLKEVRVTNLAPNLTSSGTILSRDRIVRHMIEAELGPARNSFLTPRLGMIELCLRFDTSVEPGQPMDRPPSVQSSPDLRPTPEPLPRSSVLAIEDP